jgi:hypothetical protein
MRCENNAAMLILELHFDYMISMFKCATRKNQYQLEFNVLRYMKGMHTCDMIRLILCIFIFGEKV